MATLAESLVSSSSRKLPIRVRPDLRARRHRYQGRLYWVVKDPVGLQYYRFEEEEFAILQMLDGESSLDDIAERFEREFPPQTIRTEELQQFIGMLHSSGLVITDAAGQGLQLKKRRDQRARKQRLATLTNILSIRFKGFDPERLFNVIYPYVRWFFSVPALVVCILFALAAMTLVIVQFDVFQSRLPGFQAFFGAQNWLPLALTLCITKVLHEFGHGLSCKHFGGECHEIGVMFLVLTPCLYCNVSDSWMLPNRWHRAAIGAAGMYVELVLATVCTFIWWFSTPGPLQYFALNVMFICSVSTVLFNANPLLRYDGYYILSDILEIPNLRPKASTILSRKFGKWCLGLEEPEDPFLPKRKQWLFASYTVAAAVYRWVVVLSILYFLNKVFEPYGLQVLGQLIAAGAIYGLLIQPFVKVYKYFKVPGRLAKVKRARLYTTLSIIAAIIAVIFFLPFPAHVYCPLEVQARQAKTVYVEVDGILEEVFVQPGQKVAKGDPLAQLKNVDVDIAIADLTGQRDTLKAQLEGLESDAFRNLRISTQLEYVKDHLETVEELLVKHMEDRRKLRLVAPQAGTVLPPPQIPDREHDEADLPTWSGSPMERENVGATLVRETKFCLIGDPDRLEALLLIDQDSVEDVRSGQEVEIIMAQSAGCKYFSHIEGDIAGEDRKITPTHLSSLNGGEVPTEMTATGIPKPLSPVFDAIVPLPEHNPNGLLRIGLVGKAKIHVDPRTLASRFWRYLTRTFNFEL
ncbi:MAG: biotin/lipoyl-binding protein [Pirellulales bacterium]